MIGDLRQFQENATDSTALTVGVNIKMIPPPGANRDKASGEAGTFAEPNLGTGKNDRGIEDEILVRRMQHGHVRHRVEEREPVKPRDRSQISERGTAQQSWARGFCLGPHRVGNYGDNFTKELSRSPVGASRATGCSAPRHGRCRR